MPELRNCFFLFHFLTAAAAKTISRTVESNLSDSTTGVFIQHCALAVNIQNPAGDIPEHPAVADPDLSRRLGRRISRGPFWPQPCSADVFSRIGSLRGLFTLPVFGHFNSGSFFPYLVFRARLVQAGGDSENPGWSPALNHLLRRISSDYKGS